MKRERCLKQGHLNSCSMEFNGPLLGLLSSKVRYSSSTHIIPLPNWSHGSNGDGSSHIWIYFWEIFLGPFYRNVGVQTPFVSSFSLLEIHYDFEGELQGRGYHFPVLLFLFFLFFHSIFYCKLISLFQLFICDLFVNSLMQIH